MNIRKILIANRGEIAVRIIKTCKKLGISTVAVYSDIEEEAPFVKLADEAYLIGEAEPQKSYLNIGKIVEVCKQANVDAVHPGYGFLSENETFAKTLEDNEIIFIGPKSESIKIMGDKIKSRKKMIESGVPVVPGYNGEDQNPDFLIRKSIDIGFPLMIKASAGGGGKGMKKVEKSEHFLQLLESAKREAKNAFGDDRVFLEKYITSPRHIEYQIFGDTLGNVVHLYERDCSIQRRHQKIIEESPARNIPQDTKERMGEIAVLAAKSINYIGAGTVEFIYDSSTGEFYFLEMNTRLQVEHAVTEMITNQDLVEWQILVAEGKQLPFKDQKDAHFPEQIGHAIEVRIYAEEAENNFAPSIGKIYKIFFPDKVGVRLDSGVEINSEINVYYDPMIAKLIVRAEDRLSCIEKLAEVLEESYIFGVSNNLSFLRRIISHSRFKSGKTNTHFIDDHYNSLIWNNKDNLKMAFALATLLNSVRFQTKDVWNIMPGFQFWREKTYNLEYARDFYLDPDFSNKNSKYQSMGYEVSTIVESFENIQNSFSFQIWLEEEKQGGLIEISNLQKITQNEIVFSDGNRINFFKYGLLTYIHLKGEVFIIKNIPIAHDFQESTENTYYSQMPGKITQIKVKEGDKVKRSEPILIMEAMKMENTIISHSDCVIETIHCSEGDMVGQDVLLVEVKLV